MSEAHPVKAPQPAEYRVRDITEDERDLRIGPEDFTATYVEGIRQRAVLELKLDTKINDVEAWAVMGNVSLYDLNSLCAAAIAWLRSQH